MNLKNKIPLYLLVIFILIIAFNGPISAGNQSPAEAYHLTWSYIFGSLAAIFYKSAIGVIKSISRKAFSWWALSIPLVATAIFAVPTIVYALPNFGPPSGNFTADFLYSFAFIYSIHDVSADCHKLYMYVEKKADEKNKEKSAEKKVKKSAEKKAKKK